MTSKTFTQTSTLSKMTVATLATLMVVAPFISSAQVTDKTNARFCESIDSVETKVLAKLDERLTSAQSKHAAHVATFTQKKEAVVAELKTKRDAADAKWDTQIAVLKSKAKTDEQKAAVDTFEATVEQLSTTRRTAVNSAVDTFQNGMTTLKTKGETDFKALIASHKAAMEGAFDTAKTACANGETPATVRTNLKNDLTEVRESFKTDRQALEYKTEFKALRDARVATTNQARETFKTGLAAAKETLKKAFAG